MIEKVQRITAPAVEPVSLATAKLHLRIDDDFTLEDTLIEGYISAARDFAEQYCNRSWAKATFYTTFSRFLGYKSPILMPDPSTSAIDEVSYIDGDYAVQVIDSGDYTYDADRQELRPVGNWPTDATEIKVKYTAGADASASPAEYVPEGVINAILLMIADAYETRNAQLVQNIYENPAAFRQLQPYRVEMGI